MGDASNGGCTHGKMCLKRVVKHTQRAKILKRSISDFKNCERCVHYNGILCPRLHQDNRQAMGIYEINGGEKQQWALHMP